MTSKGVTSSQSLWERLNFNTAYICHVLLILIGSVYFALALLEQTNYWNCCNLSVGVECVIHLEMGCVRRIIPIVVQTTNYRVISSGDL